MKIRHRLDASQLDEVKEQVAKNRWIPVVITAAATAIIVRVCTKTPQVNIYVTDRGVEL